MTELRVCSVGDVEPNSSRRVDVDGLRLAVVRITDDAGDTWYVIDDRCSHAEASLAEGTVWADDHEIECPLHSSTFDLRTGEAITLPATRPQRTYSARVEGEDVVVEVGEAGGR